jgi:DNA-binding MarR family transcriptional regulator
MIMNKNYSQTINELFADLYRIYHKEYHPDSPPASEEATAILEHIYSTGPLSITEASHHFSRSISAISEIISRMQTRGWVEKLVNPDNKRMKYIWLTESGIAELKRCQQVLDQDKLSLAIADIPEEKIKQMIDGMHSLVDARNKKEKS